MSRRIEIQTISVFNSRRRGSKLANRLMGDKQWRLFVEQYSLLLGPVRSNNLDKSASGDILPSPRDTDSGRTMLIHSSRSEIIRLSCRWITKNFGGHNRFDCREEGVYENPQNDFSFLFIICSSFTVFCASSQGASRTFLQG